MKFLRSCLAGGFFVAFAVGGILIGMALFPLAALFAAADERRSRDEIVSARRRRLVRAAYWLFVAGARVTGLFRVEVSPQDLARLAAIRGSVVVANHISLIDVVILVAFLGDTTAVAKVAASHNPFYARIVKSVFLVNDDPIQVLSDAGRLLGAGVNLIVFPEGTRTHPRADNRKLRRGAAQIALAANAPLEMVRIFSKPLVLGKGQPWYDVGARTIVYTLECRGAITPTPSPAATRHAAATALTAEVEKILFGRKSGGD